MKYKSQHTAESGDIACGKLQLHTTCNTSTIHALHYYNTITVLPVRLCIYILVDYLPFGASII